MLQGALQRPALGQAAELGTLYDARSDSFLPLSLLRKAPPAAAVSVIDNHTSEVQLSSNDTYEEKLSKMDLNAELSASFLSGMVSVGGSGRYLTDTRDSNQIMQASLHYKINTVHERLNFMTDALKNCLSLSVLQSGSATHVVAEISWGAQNVVTAKHRLSNNEDRANVDGCFKANFLNIKSIIKVGGKGDLTMENKEGGKGVSFEVTVYGDVLADDGLLPTDFQSAYKFISNVPRYVARANGGKGKPLMYTLLPLSMLAFLLNVEIKADIILTQLSIDCLEKFVLFFDSLRDAQQKLNDYHLEIVKHKFCVPPDHVRAVVKHVQDVKAAEASLKENYARILKDVRSGVSDSEQLWGLLKASSEGKMSPENIVALTDEYRDKMEFADIVMAKGVKYIGYKGGSLDKELMKNENDDAYVLYFNEKVRRDRDSWEGNQELLLQLLNRTERNYLVIMLDCDFNDTALDRSYISHYRNSKVIVSDLFEHNQSMVDKCFARYDAKLLDRSAEKRPLERRLVKIPCPGSHCASSPCYEWTCFKCQTPVEYGHSDQYLYCDCGRCLYQNYVFKCKEVWHGSAFARHDPKLLRQLLDALEPFDELNLLILGETGVGKSTFVNAFVNYLTFESLDDAMDHEKFNSVIPCSFAMQHIVRDESHPKGRFVQREIKIGQSDDEHNSATGQSATQKTNVYAVTRGTTMVRLIDTPGIGDTRGVEHDDINMANILSTLKNYPKLHGILILLKSNNARLTLMFRFCVKQLLTHLHRDAAQNMVFGFTNTRNSNYSPGDTFVPLNALLQEHSDVGIGLWPHTVYCFDSESFRFLAAHKSGVEMDNIEEFRRSWQHSAKETQRLLEHFRTLPPHLVRSTLSLNRAREVISFLTIPMANVAQTMKITIQVNQDKVKELNETQLEGKKLQANLHFQKIEPKTHPLDMPRTVCDDASCKEYRDVGSGKQDTVYNKQCHKECYLSDVPVERRGCSQLMGCAAFSGDHCRECGHHWGVHLHVLYEHRDELVTMPDASVQQQINRNASTVTVKKLAITKLETKIAEAKHELETIQSASVQFGMFLKKKSITPYNDAMIAYLDHLIQNESEKVQIAKVSPERLKSLKRSRNEYEQRIEVLTKSMDAGNHEKLLTEDGVDRLVKQLYSMPLWGKSLEENTATTEAAHLATYREKPYRVPKKTKDRSRTDNEEFTLVGTGESKGLSVKRQSTWKDTLGAQVSSISSKAWALVRR